MQLFDRCSPEEAGVCSPALNRFLNAFMALRYTHGVMVLRHGKIIAERYRDLCSAADRHQLFSLSKSFTSSAIGIAIGEKRLSLDDCVVDFFPEYAGDAISERMKRVTVRHLLTMSTGHKSCALFGERYAALKVHFDNSRPWVQNILEDELAYEPGSTFVYNTGATFLLSAILRKATGQNLVAYLRPRLLDPLGLPQDVYSSCNPDGIELGGYGLHLRLPEIAATAQCWLRMGKAPDGTQLIPEDYMRAASSKQISNGDPAVTSDWTQGYGYQFWQCQHGFFRADGACGQIAVIMPRFDAVCVATAGLSNMQLELDTLWNHLIPALDGATDGDSVCTPASFDFDPPGKPQPLEQNPVEYAAVPGNPIGLSGLRLEQTSDGVRLLLRYADRTFEQLEAGFQTPKCSLIQTLESKSSFAAYGRCRWTHQRVLGLTFVIPESTSVFRYTLDLSAEQPILSRTSEIYFAKPWLRDVRIPLI